MCCVYSAIFSYYQLERSGGRPAELLLVNSVVGGAEPQEGGGLARAWTDWRSEGAGERRGDSGHGITVLLRANYLPYRAVAPAFICQSGRSTRFGKFSRSKKRTAHYNRSIQEH